MDQQNTTGKDMVSLWEQMGSSTGSFIGRMIGLSAQYTLQTYEQMVTNPLKQTISANPAPPSSTGVPNDIREQTWQEMGKQYGNTLGTSIGTAMDLLIQSMKNTAQTIPGFDQTTGAQPASNSQQTNSQGTNADGANTVQDKPPL